MDPACIHSGSPGLLQSCAFMLNLNSVRYHRGRRNGTNEQCMACAGASAVTRHEVAKTLISMLDA